MDYAIEAQDLTKIYPSQSRRPAVDRVSLAIQKGQLYGLVGPDGAGKTTMLRMLSTVMNQSGGKAWVVGCDVRSEAEKARRKIGYMPQNFSLYPDLSVQENLNFFADIHRIPADVKKIRIQEMLDFTRLERFRQRRAGALSGGMKKKLALACALVHDPAVLLLDEPSTGVDPVSRRELWVILANVVQQGVTVMVSTPYMDEAERCHKVGMLLDGRLLVEGTPDELTSQLPFGIIEVKAKPRKNMRQIVSETAGIIEWRPVGDRLRLSVSPQAGDQDRIMAELSEQFQAASMEVRLLRKARPSMEDVFVHLVEKQRGPQ